MSKVDTNQIHYYNDPIPPQLSGAKSDAIEQVDCKDTTLAETCYQAACERLCNVNKWAELSHITLSSFRLFDSQGIFADRMMREGDFIRINIPGPGLKIGKGYDWVKVELVSEKVQPTGLLFSIVVRPAACPLKSNNKIAHFLQHQATSTFQIRRSGTIVFAEEHARNEKANLDTGNWMDNIRNFFVGTAARLGFSYPQWKSLVKGIINLNKHIK